MAMIATTQTGLGSLFTRKGIAQALRARKYTVYCRYGGSPHAWSVVDVRETRFGVQVKLSDNLRWVTPSEVWEG